MTYFDSRASWVNAVLHNDEASTDEELVRLFTDEGLTEEQAMKAIAQRTKCLTDMFHVVTY